MGKIEVGRYIAIYEKGGIYTNDVYGKVIAIKKNDGYTTYTLLKTDNTICEVSDKNREVGGYDDYYSHLFSDARDWKVSIDEAAKTLKGVLGEDFEKAPEIADICGDRLTPFEMDEQVIIFRIDHNYCHFQRYERGKVIGVEFPKYYTNAEYYSNKGFKGPFCIPVYTVDTENGITYVDGHDWKFSGKFIGTQDEFIRLLVNDIKFWLKQLQTIETTREELYSKVKDDPNVDTRLMRDPLEWDDPFAKELTKKCRNA